MTRTWNEKTYGPGWGLAFFHWTIINLGKRPAYFCLYFVVFAYVVFFPSVTANCKPYLSRRFKGISRFGILLRSYMLVLNFGKVLIDHAALSLLGPSCIRADFQNPEAYHRIKKLNSGFIILMSHVGCWQVAISALSRLNRSVNILMLPLDHGQEAKKRGFNIIDPGQFLGGTMEMLNVLKNDEILCIMGDRLFGNASYALDMDFLQGKAPFPFSAYKLAAITRKPIVILNTFKTGHATYMLSVPDIIHVPRNAGKKAENARIFVQEYVATLEAYTRDHPYQFFNFYDMWADPSQAEADIRPGSRVTGKETVE